jgi:RNA polymerase sigma factor (sigma-70 family)
MVKTPVLSLSHNGGFSVLQFEYECLSEAAGRLVRQGICAESCAQELALRSTQRLKLKYANETCLHPTALWNAFLTFATQEMQILQRQMDQNFGLTEKEFDEMTAALQAGDERIFELVFLKHFASCRDYLIKNFRATPEDAYDATMDTLLEFHRRLLSGKVQYGNLRYLFTKMGTQIYMKGQQKTNNLTDELQVDIHAATEEYDGELDQTLDKAWEKLGEGCRQILKAFYYNNTNLNVLAGELGKDPAAVRKQKQRCVEQLRSFFIRFS